jgi:hypothetical protein
MAWDEDLDLASVLVPTEITDARLTSVMAGGAPLPEDTSPAWSAATTYGVGDLVYSPVTHRVYESQKASNLNKDPTDIRNRTNVANVGQWWIDAFPTNKWAALDGLINSQTVGASPLVFTVRPGAANALALFGIDGDSLSVVWRDAPGGNIVHNTGTVALEGSMPADYYDYFFAPFKPLTQYTLTDVDAYAAAEATVTITSTTGTARLGMLSIGDLRPLGIPTSNARVSPKTYSRFEEDEYGYTRIQRRPKARPMSMAIAVAFEDTDSVVQTIEDVIDIPVAFIGSQAQYHSKLSTFGLISGEMDYSTFPDRILSVSIKGFI